jgi:hypothetical protein
MRAVQVCEVDVSNLHPPPYCSRQIICLAHSESVRLPLQLPMRPSLHQLHAVPGRSIPCTRAWHSSTHHRTLCAVHGLCTSGIASKQHFDTRCYVNTSVQDLRFLQRWLWRAWYSGIWRRVVRWKPTDVSEEHIASIFSVEEISSAKLHGVISQKMILFITAAVKTTNPT